MPKGWFFCAVALVFSLLLLFGGYVEVSAEEIVVDYGDPGDVKFFRLASSQRARVQVHVASVGEALDGVRISLSDAANLQKHWIAPVDAAGVAKFLDVPPGSYKVILRLPSTLGEQTTVYVGDVTIDLME